MPYSILTVPEFDRNVKSLFKRYKNIRLDLEKLTTLLQENPISGTHLFNNCYKIRLANSSIPTGKSKGFRVIIYHISQDANIYLLSIYAKSDRENISDSEIKEILKGIQ
jgi:mRNA-degrading endonuclease RelE of RelBE toxin-antitoxin system